MATSIRLARAASLLFRRADYVGKIPQLSSRTLLPVQPTLSARQNRFLFTTGVKNDTPQPQADSREGSSTTKGRIAHKFLKLCSAFLSKSNCNYSGHGKKRVSGRNEDAAGHSGKISLFREGGISFLALCSHFQATRSKTQCFMISGVCEGAYF